MYIFTHKDGTDFWVQISENQHLLVFVGITILFSTKQHRLYQATVYRQFGQDCYSGQRQFSQRGERMGLSYISECCVGRERSLGPNWTHDPVWVYAYLSVYYGCGCDSYMKTLLNGLQLLCKNLFLLEHMLLPTLAMHCIESWMMVQTYFSIVHRVFCSEVRGE